MGSSPLARGLLGVCVCVRVSVRIIPARAGFTVMPRSAGRARQDHPRSRGVYVHRLVHRTEGGGSSPLARGLPRRCVCVRVSVRIIPARAGFTVMPRSAGRARQDHPRSRGVYVHRLVHRTEGGGSSPLARGLPRRCVCVRVSVRIIPARAGFTSCSSPPYWPPRDHPRSRGVYLLIRSHAR